MPVLRLTSKLLSQIDPLPDAEVSPSPFGDWYGNLFTIDRRKCILFINEPTLFVCFVPDVVKSAYRHIAPFFIEVLTRTLRNESFSNDEIALIVGMHKNLTVGRTLNRSTVGSLNNRARDAKSMIQWYGGLEGCSVKTVTHLLNNTPMKPIGYLKGLEKMTALLAGLKK